MVKGFLAAEPWVLARVPLPSVSLQPVVQRGTGAIHWTTSVEVLSPTAVLVVPRYLYENVQRKVNN